MSQQGGRVGSSSNADTHESLPPDLLKLFVAGGTDGILRGLISGFGRSTWALMRAFPPMPLAADLRHTCLTELQATMKVSRKRSLQHIPTPGSADADRPVDDTGPRRAASRDCSAAYIIMNWSMPMARGSGCSRCLAATHSSPELLL